MPVDIDAIQTLGLGARQSEQPRDELGQAQFLNLLTTQLRHQDPLNPTENGDFLGQLAQFSTVSGIQDLQASFRNFADSLSSGQSLQAAQLVGREVLVPSARGYLSGSGPLQGAVDVPNAADDVTIQIKNPQGDLLETIRLGPQAPGQARFAWDGLLSDGSYAQPGLYNLEAFTRVDGRAEALDTLLQTRVESVSTGANGLGIQVHTQGLDAFSFNQVKQIL